MAVVLPAARAAELQQYFEQHPEQVRPFFISGGLEHFSVHLPPPFREMDQRYPDAPILFQRFDDYAKLVEYKIVPFNQPGKTAVAVSEEKQTGNIPEWAKRMKKVEDQSKKKINKLPPPPPPPGKKPKK